MNSCADDKIQSGRGNESSVSDTEAADRSTSDSAPPGFARSPDVPDHTVDSSTSTTTDQGWRREDLVRDVSTFLNAIEQNDSAAFMASLSRRTRAMIEFDSSITAARIWNGARNTIGAIKGRKITLLGGRLDSVALRIEGTRIVDGVATGDPVEIDLLRERGQWRVAYPGLHYPQGHMIR